VVEQRAHECQAARVKAVRIQIGEASGVATDSLTFSFAMLAGCSPILNGARLSVECVPHRARCRHCAQDFAVKDFVLRCPICAEWSTETISGTECQILEMEIE
jgi:hydrogenase nickel incorporation protein HypA/HybF